MRMFIGSVIMESLTTQDALTGLAPVAERIVDVPDDPDATVWHTRWYRLAEHDLHNRLPALARAMKAHWYAHFWADDDLYVIMAGRFFRASASDRTTWRGFIDYGDTVGVDRKWLETVPTVVPEWVRVAMASGAK